MLAKIFYRLPLAIALYFASLPANAVTYTFTDLGTPSGSMSVANSINNSGQIVGVATSSNSIPWHAMLWDNGVAIQLDIGESHAYGINNSGQIVGVGSNRNATLWHNGSVTDLGLPGGGSSKAYGISESGQVVGTAYNAIIWNNGVATRLASLDSTNMVSEAFDINSSGQIVGISFTQEGNHAALWSNGSITDLGTLGNGYVSQASSINDSGQIVGWSASEAAGMIRATLWSNGGVADLGALHSGGVSNANSINNLGQIVGWSSIDTNYLQIAATLWSNGNIIDLNTLLSASDVAAGWKLISANSINDNGSIVGQARNNLLGIHAGAFLMSVTPVPEADTSAMLLMGAGVMGFMARRRKQVAA
jgi:probable HAF family extracellular repeat protein